MRAVIQPRKLSGTLDAISSKSDAHRVLLCAALADAPTRVEGIDTCDDIDATMRCVSALGACVDRRARSAVITPNTGQMADGAVFDCGECGATLRFFLPVAAMRLKAGQKVLFRGSGRLPERPIGDLLQALSAQGIRFDGDRLPLVMQGSLEAGDYSIPGHISSQFLSGLLLALPQLSGESRIRITTPMQSVGYVEMTLHTLKRFGVEVHTESEGYLVPGAQPMTTPGSVRVEGDWSNMACFLAAGVRIKGLSQESLQKDRQIMALLELFGARVRAGDEMMMEPGELHGAEIDASDVPDLVPVLAVLGAQAQGTTRIYGAAHLRLKESDRIQSVCAMLNALGGRAQELSDGLLIEGTGGLTGGQVDCQGDHRIVMAASLAACVCKSSVTLLCADAVAKSYPRFFSDYQSTGGCVECHP